MKNYEIGDLRIWKAEEHTVTSLEVQAVRIWARMMSNLLSKGGVEERTMAGFLSGVAEADDHTTAQHIMIAKKREMDAGRQPASAEPIPQ